VFRRLSVSDNSHYGVTGAGALIGAALRQVIERRGIFCALYSDRGSLFWLTPKAGGKVERQRLTQVGRALRELGIQMIPAYSPEARRRSERSFSTWQGRLPQELRLRGITTVETANHFLDRTYIVESNRRFQVPAEQPGTAFLPPAAQDLDLVFSLHHERVVNRDNTLQFENRCPQIEPVCWRGTLSGCVVTVRQHLDGDLSLSYGQHLLGRYPGHGAMIRAPDRPTAEKPRGGKVQMPTFPPRLEIPPTARDSHFPTAAVAAAG
jgi:hypothetical protein